MTDQHRFPAPLAALFARLPKLPPSLACAAALDLALRPRLPIDALHALEGRRVHVRVSDTGLEFRLTVRGGGFRPALGRAAPDLVIAASSRDFLSLARREEDPDTLFFARRLVMEGDTELGLTVKNALDGLDFESLARDGLRALTPWGAAAALRRRLPA